MTEVYCHHALPPGAMIREFRLIRVLGSGSFGIVYTAENKYFSGIFALKEFLPTELACRPEGDTRVVPLSSDTENAFYWARNKFLEEAKILWELGHPDRHPNIVHVQQFIEANETAYMVMDYEEGRSLSKILKERKTLPEEELRHILEPLLDGLERVHTAAVWHRDIKPSNILIRSDGSPVLIDFGAARQEIAGTDRSVLSQLTPAYAALEQVYPVGRHGPWTDIYALGATLYRAVTGNKPINAADRHHSFDYQPAVHAATSGYSQTFLNAIDAALELMPEKRPQSIAEWRNLLNKEQTIIKTEEIDDTIIQPNYRDIQPPIDVFKSPNEITNSPKQEPISTDNGIGNPKNKHRRSRLIGIAFSIFIISIVGFAVYRYLIQSSGDKSAHVIPMGSLIVTLKPNEVIKNGAQWRVDGSSWNGSGDEITKIVVGAHEVEFKDIHGWETPSKKTINISENVRTTFSGSYVLNPPAADTGFLTVTISPSEVNELGSQWKIEGGAWQNTFAELSLDTGRYNLHFREIDGWEPPETKVIEIHSGEDIRISGFYKKRRTPISQDNFKLFYIKPDKDHGVSVLQEADILTHNDLYYFEFKPDKESYLYMVKIDSSGIISRIFPNEKFDSKINPLVPGVKHRFPGQDFFELGESHIGKEWIFVIVSESQMTDVENIFSQLQSVDDFNKDQLWILDEIKGQKLLEDFKLIFERQQPGNVWKIWFWHEKGPSFHASENKESPTQFKLPPILPIPKGFKEMLQK